MPRHDQIRAAIALRRGPASPGSHVLGRFVLEPWRQLLESGQPVSIGGKALDLLSVLAEAGGDLVTKDELMAAVWPGVVVEENAIQVHVSAGRRALGDEAGRLSTVRGRGYRLETDPCAPAEPVVIHSLAVLAFANLTGDVANDFISDGIAEELITTLSRSTSLKVPARTSSFAYKGRATDIRTIGRELGVAAVLEGSLRKSAERIRVTAQLIETATGYHLWAQNFERSDGDLLALQDDLAGAIGRALHAQIGASNFRTHDPEAFRLNMQGRALSACMNPESLMHAIALQGAAITRDPGYADAWTGLAGTLMVGTMTGALPLDRRFEARSRAEEAIRLDRGAASPYAISAVLDAAAGNWLDARAAFAAAIELDEGNPVARSAQALHLLGPAGQMNSARDQMKRAVADGPADGNLYVTCAVLAAADGDLDAVAAALETARLLGVPERSTVLLLRAEIERGSGDWRQAGALTTAAVAQWPGFGSTTVAGIVQSVFAAAGGETTAEGPREALSALIAKADADASLWQLSGAAGHFMVWQVWLASIDGAYAVAERLIGAWRRSGHLSGLSLNQIWRPDMQPFRDDPRFGDFTAKLGLPALWRQIGGPNITAS